MKNRIRFDWIMDQESYLRPYAPLEVVGYAERPRMIAHCGASLRKIMMRPRSALGPEAEAEFRPVAALIRRSNEA